MKRSIKPPPGNENAEPAYSPGTLNEDVYRRLRCDIIAGILPPGAPLRSGELREVYGVGISPLREALSRLHAEHLVTSVAQRGFRVWPLTVSDVFDTMETRILIESEALRLSIELGDVTWETQLVGAAHTLRRTPLPSWPATDNGHWANVHRNFHLTLLSACGSPWLIKIAEMLFEHAERHRMRAIRFARPSTSRDRPAEHDGIFRAAIERNAKLALAELDRHYRLSAHHVAETLDAAPDSDIENDEERQIRPEKPPKLITAATGRFTPKEPPV